MNGLEIMEKLEAAVMRAAKDLLDATGAASAMLKLPGGGDIRVTRAGQTPVGSIVGTVPAEESDEEFARQVEHMGGYLRSFTICKDHSHADWNQPTLEDDNCVLCHLFYLEAQEGLLEEWQERAKRAEEALAEVKRPLDAQMARLNATVERLNGENELLRKAAAPSSIVPTFKEQEINDALDIAECCVHDQVKDPNEREHHYAGLKKVRELALATLHARQALVEQAREIAELRVAARSAIAAPTHWRARYFWLLHNGGLLNEWAANWIPANDGPLIPYLDACVDRELGFAAGAPTDGGTDG